MRRDASGHTAEVVDFEQLFKFKFDRYQAEGMIVPEDVDRVEWWQAEVVKFAFKPFGQSDTFCLGQTFCPDLVGYPGLGIPNDGMRATLNPKPHIGPADAVMVTVEDTKSGGTVARYWLAPYRGFMCVRSEMPYKETGWISWMTYRSSASDCSPSLPSRLR